MRAILSAALALLLVASLVAWFANLGARKLIKPDEGRYAEIAREMTVTGDWVTPRLNGIKYFEKPPLHYWATATAFTLFGRSEWAARLWPALTGLAGILWAWFLGGRLFGRTAGPYSATVLGSSLMYVVVAHLNTLDMGLTLFTFLGLGAFLLAQRDEASREDMRFWMHVAWVATALAVLTKGLVALALPGAALVLYTLIERDWRVWTRLHVTTGLPLMLLIAAPWFVLVSLRNPEFPWFFFVREHLLRFTTTVHGRDEPWWYFGPLLLAGALPWTATLVDAVSHAWRRDPRARFQARRFLIAWSVGTLVFFSVSGSKLPSYILPIFPALALLAGWRLVSLPVRTLFWQVLPVAVLAAAGMAALIFVKSSGDTPVALIEAFKPWAYAALSVFVAGSLLALWRARRGDRATAVGAVAFVSLIALQLLLAAHNALAPSVSSHDLAQKMKPYLKPGVPLYSLAMYDQTLNFYLDRTVTLVQFRDELDFGLKQEPHLAFASFYDWEKVWRQQPYALALMPKEMYDILVAQNFPMALLINDHRRYLVRTP